MTVCSIVLTDQDNNISKNHIVLNYLPEYVEYFQKLTKGFPVIMDRFTFEAIGHILKGRKKIVITRSERYHSSSARTASSLEEALESSRRYRKAFVIGSSRLYKVSLPISDELYITNVKTRFRATDYFPEVNTDDFDLESAECIHRNEVQRFEYCIEKWVRSS